MVYLCGLITKLKVLKFLKRWFGSATLPDLTKLRQCQVNAIVVTFDSGSTMAKVYLAMKTMTTAVNQITQVAPCIHQIHV